MQFRPREFWLSLLVWCCGSLATSCAPSSNSEPAGTQHVLAGDRAAGTVPEIEEALAWVSLRNTTGAKDRSISADAQHLEESLKLTHAFQRSFAIDGLDCTDPALLARVPRNIVVVAFRGTALRAGSMHLDLEESRSRFQIARFNVFMQPKQVSNFLVALRFSGSNDRRLVQSALFELTDSEPRLIASGLGTEKYWLPTDAPSNKQWNPRWMPGSYLVDNRSGYIALWTWNGRDSDVMASMKLCGDVGTLLGELPEFPEQMSDWPEPVVTIRACFVPDIRRE